jgi:hypothetical protein
MRRTVRTGRIFIHVAVVNDLPIQRPALRHYPRIDWFPHGVQDRIYSAGIPQFCEKPCGFPAAKGQKPSDLHNRFSVKSRQLTQSTEIALQSKLFEIESITGSGMRTGHRAVSGNFASYFAYPNAEGDP